jgi:uncharacterized protein (TIGR03083 family)
VLILDAARTAIRREVASSLALLDGLDAAARARPTRCAGWTVADLVAHLSWGQRLEAAGFAGGASGQTEPVELAAIPLDEPPVLRASFADGHAALDAELTALTDADLGRLCPMPFGLAPAALLLQIVTMEVGVHGSDLADAVDQPATLAPDVVDATAMVLGVFLPALATGPEAGADYRFVGDGVDVRFRHDGTAWSTAAPDGDGDPAVTFTGSGSDLCLFLLGRGSIEERRLEVDGDLSAAARFRQLVPGM